MPSPNQAQTKAEIQAKRNEFMELLSKYMMAEIGYHMADAAKASGTKDIFAWNRNAAYKAILEFVFPAKEETETEAAPAYESLKAENAKLEAMLDAVGAGGVGVSIKPSVQADTAQEPVAWRVHPFDYGVGSKGVYALTMLIEQVEMWKRKGWEVEPLYTAPQPTRQPLTDEQILSIVRVAPALDTAEAEWLHVARAIEAAASNQASQPLTNEQIIAIADKARAAEGGDAGYILPIAFARAIEAAHGITGSQQ